MGVSRLSPSLTRLACFVAALVCSHCVGCISSRAFVPAEHVTGFSPNGEQLAAEYALLEEGETLGDVKVWSDGAERDGSQTTVRVAFELTNQSHEPLRFDAQGLFLEELPEKGKAAGRERASRLDGDTLVPAGESRQLAATFTLPSGVWPSDVPGYRVGWTVLASKSHSRKTPFMYMRGARDPDPWGPAYGPYYGYYPGLYGAWPVGYRWPPPWGRGRYYYPYYYPAYWR
jgi:hypothetical protein